MIRTLKALMVAATAALMLGAIGASVAQAHTPAVFNKPAEAVQLTILADGATGKEKHHVLDAAGGNITCAGVEAPATVAGTETTVASILTTSVTYTGPCLYNGQTAELKTNECNYRFHASGLFDIVCPAGKLITFAIPATGCDVEFPAQTGRGTVTYTNIANGDVTLSPVVKNIEYTVTGAGCPVVAGTYNNGEYTTGNVIVAGEKDDGSGTPVNISRSPTTGQAHTPAVFNKPAEAVQLTTLADGTSNKEKHHVFDAAGGNITCAGVEAPATVAGTGATVTSIITTSVTYTGPCVFNGLTAEVKTNECNYRFHASGLVDIACPAGKFITFAVPATGCDVDVPAQTGKGTVTYTNIANGDVTLSPVVSNIAYTVTGAGCPVVAGNYTNGEYTTGNVIVSGEKDDGSGTAVNISHSPTVPQT